LQLQCAGEEDLQKTFRILAADMAAFALLSLLAAPSASAAERLSLAGRWRFRLDPQGVGLKEKWFEARLPYTVHLPGSVEEQGLGVRTEKPATGRLTRIYEYVGPAWFQKEVTIPASWEGKRITLFLERCHWETRVWVDGRSAGMQNSLIAPHTYDLSCFLAPGRHRLAFQVDNTVKIDIGGWAHAITDETQTNWNGIIGRMELIATDPIWIESLEIYPDLRRKVAFVKVGVGNSTGARASGKLRLQATLQGQSGKNAVSIPFTAPTRKTDIEIRLPMGKNIRLWDEFSPFLYDLKVALSASRFADERTAVFGMREIGKKGTQFAVNGRTIFLRGTLECCIFPLTGYPAMDVGSWLRIFKIAKSYGLNHFRFHSWCPPEAAFVAADRMGILFQVENPLWIGGDNVGGDPQRAAFIRAEADRILKVYGNHPSFGMMSMGNELGNGDEPFLQGLVAYCKRKDPRHLYTCTTHPYNPRPHDDYFVSAGTPKGLIRGQSRLRVERPATDRDYRNALAGIDRPVVSHEVGQWAMYPDFREIKKYTGALQARNFEGYRESLARHHMLDQAEDFRRASGALMLLLYKEEIESIMRTPDSPGFQLLDVRDFPGQGTALVGMLDPFWDSKGLIVPEVFRQYCSPTVSLLRMKKREWTTDETFSAVAEIAHYGKAPLRIGGARGYPAIWAIKDKQGRQIASGSFLPATIPAGRLSRLGEIIVPLAQLAVPAKYVVEVSIQGTPCTNRWDIWVYPARVDTSPSPDIYVATAWDQETRSALKAGRKVLLFPPVDRLYRTIPGAFTPVYWSFRWFPGQPGTLGLLCNPHHPALAQFPTESHSNWQWWDLMAHSKAIILDDTPADFRPIVQIIDDFNRNQKLGAIFEARVGEGKLLVCSIDLGHNLEARPAARQMRHSLLRYMRSDRFVPAPELAMDVLDKLFEVSPLYRMEREPKDFSQAALDVRASLHVPQWNIAYPWRPEYDEMAARKEGFDYRITGGTWRDETGAAWHDYNLAAHITCPRRFEGTLYAHFYDWNSLGRTAEVSFNGRSLGSLGDHTKGFWLALPVASQDSAEGRLELEARTTSGPNIMITRIVLIPDHSN